MKKSNGDMQNEHLKKYNLRRHMEHMELFPDQKAKEKFKRQAYYIRTGGGR